MSDSANRAKSIFLEAVERHAPEDWPAFVERACAGDVALRAEVERLLRARLELGSFHEAQRPNLAATTDEPGTERSGTVIGPYKLLERVGEGGMGAVWLAEQTKPIQRRVALKVIKDGIDSKQVLARFEAERQALALMEHPNIAKVLDAGKTPSGRPYFVMELVKGKPITAYCDDKRLGVRERLELFGDVCRAVQHSHQKGIIHRDIKPSNVLVAPFDGKPVVKVIDFGVLKATGQRLTDKTMFTGFGGLVGTPEYMSPEQAEVNNQDIDTRSDIYSLGVLLYELLTGSTPITRQRTKEAALLEVLRIIREEEPPRPSTRLSTTEELPSVAANRGLEPKKLSGLVRGELDWIVMKALDKDRNRRYETANDFAMDVQRYLADDPIAAGPPSASYRLRKFVRRNKGPLMASSLLLVSLMGGIIGTTFGLIAASRQRDAAQERETETRAVLDFLEHKVLAAARPEGQDGGLGRDVTLGRAVDAALTSVDESFREQPLIEARLRMTLGTTFGYLSEPNKAVEQFLKARSIRAKHLGIDHPDTLMTMNSLANSYLDLGRKEDALELHRQTLALRQAKLGLDHPDTLMSMNNLAATYRDLGRFTESLKLNDKTLALRKAKLGLNHYETLMSMYNLANNYRDLGRHLDALKLREEIAALMKLKFGPAHPDTLRVMMSLANSYSALGRHADALKLHQETLALQTSKLGPYHTETLLGEYNLANFYQNLGRHADAITLYEATLPKSKQKLGTDHSNTVNIRNNLALSYAAVGRYMDALKLHEETLQVRRAKLGATHPEIAVSLYNIACVHALMIRQSANPVKQTEVAMEWLKKAIAAGFQDAAQIKKDTDLDRLREREDFKKLIAELEASKDKKK